MGCEVLYTTESMTFGFVQVMKERRLVREIRGVLVKEQYGLNPDTPEK